MACRRCNGSRLIRLDKRVEEDHDVYRCGECGYIFSPSSAVPVASIHGDTRRHHADAHE